jgi:hypothetical protein
MNAPPSPAALVIRVEQELQGMLERSPGQPTLRIPRVFCEQWLTTLGLARVVFAHPETTRTKLLIGIGVLAFLAGLTAGLSLH